MTEHSTARKQAWRERSGQSRLQLPQRNAPSSFPVCLWDFAYLRWEFEAKRFEMHHVLVTAPEALVDLLQWRVSFACSTVIVHQTQTVLWVDTIKPFVSLSPSLFLRSIAKAVTANLCFCLVQAVFFSAFHSLYIAGHVQKDNAAGQKFLQALHSSREAFHGFCRFYKPMRNCWGNWATGFFVSRQPLYTLIVVWGKIKIKFTPKGLCVLN